MPPFAKIAITAASSLFTAASSLSQGRLVQAAAEQERAQLDQQLVLEKVRAEQEEAERLKTRKRNIGTQIAFGTGLNFDVYGSASFRGLLRETKKTAARDIANIRLNALTRNSALKTQIEQTKITGEAGRLKGFYGAGYALTTAGLDIGEILGNIPRSKRTSKIG
jgi:hypothetical protein